MKIKAGRETLNTNFDVTATKFSLITFSFFNTYPRITIKKTGATIFPVKIIFSSKE
jgi:hypothetical protein